MEPNQTQQETAPQTPDVGTLPDEKNNANLVIVVVLAVIVVVLALMYLWGSSATQLPPAPPAVEDTTPVASDEVEALEQDLATPELDTLDADLNQMEVELDAELQVL